MSDFHPQPLTIESPAARAPAGGALHAPHAPPARAAFALQRRLLLRARRALFARLEPLGGVPTIDEDDAQAALDEAATRAMGSALRLVLEDAFAHRSMPAAHREYWARRAPPVLAFGARQHGELARLVVRPDVATADPRVVHAVALFQLAASLLDWIGDDLGGGAEVAHLLPAGGLARLVGDAGARERLRQRAEGAGGATRAFVTVLVALLELVVRLPADPAPFARLVGAAYDAELASFAAAATPAGERAARARRKAELPTLVCGTLARIGCSDADGAMVERAAAAVAPLFRLLDDLADLGDDLRTGQLNALAAGPAGDDAAVERALREFLADDAVERHAAVAAECVERVHAIALEAGVPGTSRRAMLQWLRVRAWQWLS